MNKLKYIIPLFGTIAATATTVPLMVSCNKKTEVECDAQKILNVHPNDDVLVHCHFTGKLNPVEYEGEKASMFDAAVYQGDDDIHEADWIKALPITPPNSNDATKNFAYDFIDDNGDFTFNLHVMGSASVGSTINFRIKILVLDANGIFRQVIDGFSWKVVPLGEK